MRIVQVNKLHQQIGVAFMSKGFGKHQDTMEEKEKNKNIEFGVHQDATGDAMEAIDLI